MTSHAIDPFDIVRVSLIPDIGPARGRALLHHYHSFDGILHARARDLAGLNGFDTKLAEKTCMQLRNPELPGTIEKHIARYTRACEQHGISLVTYRDAAFPNALKNIYDPPLYLFIRGSIEVRDEKCIAVVGTRSATQYGKQVAEKLTAELSQLGITIISGLATGIDSIAHRVALGNGTRTIAVLGSGVDKIYPSQNTRLAVEIEKQGAIVSEFPPGTIADAVNFPRRNRIITGLALGVLVVETALKGGSMITAQLAFDQNRPVFAVPGSIFEPRSAGTNFLIRTEMATLVQTVDDLLRELPQLAATRTSAPPVQLTLIEDSIIQHITNEPRHIDEIALAANLTTSDLLVQLLQLEFKGVVRQLSGKMFVRLWA